MTVPAFGSLFSGIGGLDLGLERAGWRCRWQVEIDPFCQRVLAKHWPSVPRYGDIRALDLERVEPVDLVCGGFPCQPVSVAGKRLAQADERWLWPEFARVIRALRPRLVLVENVSGLLNRGIGDVLGDLAALGYDAEWQCISASDVGAPHLRERVWIVAFRGGGEDVADADGWRCDGLGVAESAGQQGAPGRELDGRGEVREQRDAAASAHAQRERLERFVFAGPASGPTHRPSDGSDPGWWATEPDVGRVAHGVPARVDRLRSLGNAVVPQVAERIGRQLLHQLASTVSSTPTPAPSECPETEGAP